MIFWTRASKHVFQLRWLTEQKEPKFLRSWQNAQRDTTNFAVIIRGLQMWFSYVNTVGPNHPLNIACALNLRLSLDFCYLLSKLARWATINDRKLFWIFFSLKYKLWLDQNGDNCILSFLSQTYIIWKSIGRGAKYRNPLFDATRLSRVSAPPDP